MSHRSSAAGSRSAVTLFLGAFALLGYLSAHSVAYDLAGLAGDHHHVHGYVSWLEVSAGIGLTLGLAGTIILAFRRTSVAGWLHPELGARRRVFGWGGAMPAAVFVVAEFVERWAAGAPLPPPTSVLAIGVVVQACLGIAAYALARWCIRFVGDAVGRLRAAAQAPRHAPYAFVLTPVDGPPPRGVMARSLAGRAPPGSR